MIIMEKFYRIFSLLGLFSSIFLLITSFIAQKQIVFVAAEKLLDVDIALDIIYFLLPSTHLCNGKGGIANMKSVVYVQDVYGKG